MVLTHAHNDHSGRILQLISEGFSGNIYCTDATKKILFEMYDDGWNYDYVKKKYFWSKTKREKITKIHPFLRKKAYALAYVKKMLYLCGLFVRKHLNTI